MQLKRAEKGVRVIRLGGQLRAADADGDKPRRIEGTSAPYDTWTTMIDRPRYRWRERYQKGCFDESIRSSDVRCMFNHNVNQILGRTSNGTLTLDPSGDALTYSVRINSDDPMAVAVWARVRRGDVVGGSTWFIPTEVHTARRETKDGYEEDDTIVRAELWEQGPVVDGAYTDTDAAARARMRVLGIDDATALEREVQAILSGGKR